MFSRAKGKTGGAVGGNYRDCAWFVWPEDRQAHHAYTTSHGWVPGMSSYLMRRHDGMNWAVLFNSRNGRDGRPLMIRFRDVGSAASERTSMWSVSDQFLTFL